MLSSIVDAHKDILLGQPNKSSAALEGRSFYVCFCICVYPFSLFLSDSVRTGKTPWNYHTVGKKERTDKRALQMWTVIVHKF